jgi:hypothetical protein
MLVLRLLSLVSVLIVAGASLAAPAYAQDDQVTLTAPMVENFIAAHAELSALAVELTKKYGDRSETAGDDPVASLPAFQDVPEAKTRSAALLGRYHYQSFDELDIVTNSVMLAYQADVPDTGVGQASQDGSAASPDSEEAKAKAEIEADTSLTPEKKKEALQQIEEQYASLQDATPLPGNAEIVKPYIDKLKPIAEAN